MIVKFEGFPLPGRAGPQLGSGGGKHVAEGDGVDGGEGGGCGHIKYSAGPAGTKVISPFSVCSTNLSLPSDRALEKRQKNTPILTTMLPRIFLILLRFLSPSFL